MEADLQHAALGVDTALLPGVTEWKRLYRMRRELAEGLAPCAPHSLADAPSIGLDDVHVLCELWLSRHDERAFIAKLYDGRRVLQGRA